MLQRDEAAQQALADVLARARGEAERRRARLKELLEAIDGEAGLFHRRPPLSAVAPGVVVPAVVDLPAYQGVHSEGAPMIWGVLGAGYPKLAGMSDPGRQWGYAIAVYQFLVRIPAVAVWLERHAGHAVGQTCCEPCALCLLHDARRSLGQPSLARFLRLIAGSATGTESADDCFALQAIRCFQGR